MDATTSVTTSSRNASQTRPRRTSPAAVQRASAFLRDHGTEGVRIADLSQVAGVSERTLRNAFHREHGVSPKQFDIRRRLNDARRALSSAEVSDTVTAIATRFGFFELGRFARLYKNAFGESPSHTLRLRVRAASQGSII